MTTKDFLTRITKHYEPNSPAQEVLSDIRRMLNTWRFNPAQMQELYDRCIQECAYFPRVADIVLQASKLCLPMRDKPKERVWLTFHDEHGRTWAKKGPYAYIETAGEQEQRYSQDCVPQSEGLAIYMREYMAARSDSYTGPQPLRALIDTSMSEYGVEVEVVSDGRADYDDAEPSDAWDEL